MQVLAWCALALLLGLSPALAQNKTFSKQRKYVTPHQVPPTAEIPVAPEGLPDPSAAPAPVAEPAPVAPAPAPVAPAVAPAPVTPAPALGPPIIAAPTPAPAAAPVYAAPAAPPPVAAAPYPAPVYPPVAPAPVAPHPGWLPAPAPAAPVAAAPVVVVPPGYVLVPVPPAPAAPQPPSLVQQEEARRAWIVGQLAQVDQQLVQLKQERKSIGGPIVQMVLGYAGTLVFAAVALGSYGTAESIEHDQWNDDWDHDYDSNDEDRLRNTAYAFTGLTAVALAVGIGGTVRLARNSAHNKLLNVERRNLVAQRTSLRQQLTYGAAVLPGQLQIGVRGNF